MAVVASAAVAPLVRRLRSGGMGGSVVAAVGTLVIFGVMVAIVAVSAVALTRRRRGHHRNDPVCEGQRAGRRVQLEPNGSWPSRRTD